jgi:pimeloyl-ACP methyl ester carboxylesterase
MNTSTVKLTDLPAQGHLVDVNDMEMYYEEYGEGDPIIFLHGFTSYSQYWRPFVDDFAKHYRVILIDLRGHGRSTNPSNQFTHRQSALDVFALLDTLKIDRFRAVGFSAGGCALLHMATQQRERIQNMILVATTHYFPKECRDIIQDYLAPDSAAWDWNSLRQRHVYGDEQIRALLTHFHNQKDSYDDMNFTPPYLSTVTAKTLIVHGDRDPFFPVFIPVEMYKAIPNSTLWIIPNGDHVELITDREAEFSQVVLRFMQ